MEKTDTSYCRDFEVTKDVSQAFDQYGFIIIRGLFDSEEIGKIKTVLETDGGIVNHAYQISDGDSGMTKLCIWSLPGNDITGMVARCEKMVNTMEKLLKQIVYHFSSKLMMKEPNTGGQHVWHQDYGYWYKDGCLSSDMGTVFIAVDECTKANGCLQVIPGSHKCGRIDHIMVGGQTGADMERVKHVQGKLGLHHVEMKPGDALFFHSNLLHKSDANHSEQRRWAFLIAYNGVGNQPLENTNPHLIYQQISKVPNTAVKDCHEMDITGKDFWDPCNDKTIIYEEQDRN